MSANESKAPAVERPLGASDACGYFMTVNHTTLTHVGCGMWAAAHVGGAFRFVQLPNGDCVRVLLCPFHIKTTEEITK